MGCSASVAKGEVFYCSLPFFINYELSFFFLGKEKTEQLFLYFCCFLVIVESLSDVVKRLFLLSFPSSPLLLDTVPLFHLTSN